MSRYRLSHLDDLQLEHALSSLAAQDLATTADVVAHLGEAHTRRFFLAAGYPSLHAYCVGQLRYSEDAADKRIRVGRLAHDYPGICELLADGRLSLSTILLLAPRLKPGCAQELIAAAAGKSRSQVEYLLACRFPQSDTFEFTSHLAAVEQPHDVTIPEPAPGRVDSAAPAAQLAAPPRAATKPLSADRVEWRLTVSRATQEKLERAQALLGYRVRGGDVAELLDRALQALIVTEEKRRYAMHRKPRKPRGKRAVARREPRPELKFPHEDDVRAALTMLKFNPAEVSIGVCEAARLGPEADAQARVKAALAALRSPHAKKLAPTPMGVG